MRTVDALLVHGKMRKGIEHTTSWSGNEMKMRKAIWKEMKIMKMKNRTGKGEKGKM
jgi:hypothetical protein